MSIAVSLSSTKNYILNAHKDLTENFQPKFELKTLSARHYAEVIKLASNMGTDKETTPDNYNQTFLEICKKGLKRWDGLVDESGNPVEFDYGKMECLLDILSFGDLYELVEAIIEFNSLGKNTAKN